MLELLAGNYSRLTKQELKIFNQIQFIFVEYLYNPRHEPIDMNMLYSDLKDLGNLIYIKIKGKKKTTSTYVSSSRKSSRKSSTRSASTKSSDKGFGINKTIKNRGEKTSISFKRKPQQKRFKNPVFLSLK
jgi:GR25 family glycosyltransferase involved in LPS biosynthesis